MKNLIIMFCICTIAIGCSAQEQKTYYENGTLKRIYLLSEEGLYDGIDKVYYRNGNLKKITHWDNGKLTDSIVNYDRSENVISKGYILNDTLKFYRADNNTLEFLIPLKEGRENGTGTYYSETGNIIGFIEYEEGLKDGFSILFDKENRPEFIAEYDSGETQGITIDFYENGAIKLFEEKNEYGDGKVIKFYANGKIKSYVGIKKGKADGLKYIYNESGILEEKVLYAQGQVIRNVDNRK